MSATRPKRGEPNFNSSFGRASAKITPEKIAQQTCKKKLILIYYFVIDKSARVLAIEAKAPL